jgi:peptide-methionine (S)-S-oxide reductase
MLKLGHRSSERHAQRLPDDRPPLEAERIDGAERATFAAGCFRDVEAAFREIEGVLETTVGYTGGDRVDPTYKQVRRGGTGHAEAVEVWFDPAQVSYEQLLESSWEMHTPRRVTARGGMWGASIARRSFSMTATRRSSQSLRVRTRRLRGASRSLARSPQPRRSTALRTTTSATSRGRAAPRARSRLTDEGSAAVPSRAPVRSWEATARPGGARGALDHRTGWRQHGT